MEATKKKERHPAPEKKRTGEHAKLLRKLRWCGLEDEAHKLQSEMNELPPEDRGTVSAGPFSTD